MRHSIHFTCAALAYFLFVAQAAAQNVSGYGAMPDPTLFLLREPALQRALKLTEAQTKQLVEFNETYDGILLATRNQTPEDSQKKIAQVIQKSREHVTRSFSTEQQQRLRQIMYRLRGMSFVLLPTPSSELQLTEDQRAGIEAAVKTALEKISKVQSSTFQGKEENEKIQRAIMAARREEQEDIFATLTNRQKQIFNALVGPTFDSNRLGRVSFKAPDLTGATEWLNTRSPLTLEDMKGKVVALHFYAFG